MKYRIVQISKDIFEVQFKRFLFWNDLNAHGSLQSAKRCIKYQKENKYPKVIR